MAWWMLACAFLTVVAASEQLSTPQYAVVHTGPDFEVRSYEPTKWMSSLEQDISFRSATTSGFLKLFRYIQGANGNSVEIPMTTPVLTGIVPSEGPFCASAFNVRFYVPPSFQAAPPEPLPALHLTLESWGRRCIATRQFPGFADDENVAVEASKLAASLQNSSWNASSYDSYIIAQYNSPFEITGRRNEVWVMLSAENCARNSMNANF